GTRVDCLQFFETGWILAAVDEPCSPVAPLQVTRHRQTCCAEAEYEVRSTGLQFRHRGTRPPLVVVRCVHRIFKLASPMRTRMTVMIQKRTMTFGSAHPFSSKW